MNPHMNPSVQHLFRRLRRLRRVHTHPLRLLAGIAFGVSAFAPHSALSAINSGADMPPDPAKNLTLEESVSRAIRESTTVLKTTRDAQLSGTQVLQSYLQFLPNLSAQAGYNWAKGTIFSSVATPVLVNASTYGANYVINTTLNLFNGFSDISAWRSSQDRRNAADKTLFRAKQQIALDVTQGFLQLVLDQKLISIAEKNLRASKDRQTLLQEQTNVGLRNKSDLFRQIAQTSADEAFLINVDNKKQNDQILLLTKLRIDPRENYQIIEPDAIKDGRPNLAAFAPPLEPDAVDEALNRRSDLDVSRLTASAAHHDVTASLATYWPKLDFVASYAASSRSFDYQTVNGVDVVGSSTFPSTNNQLHDQGQYVYGVLLTWNLFDRWSGIYNSDKAKAAAYKAELDSDDYRRQVIGEVKKSLIDFKAAAQQMETSERGLVAAQKAYEVAEGRYEVGSITYVDLATAQTALVQAEANRAQALIGYELQKRVIDFAIGTTATE